jgi:hypothetical protein
VREITIGCVTFGVTATSDVGDAVRYACLAMAVWKRAASLMTVFVERG